MADEKKPATDTEPTQLGENQSSLLIEGENPSIRAQATIKPQVSPPPPKKPKS